MIQIAGSLSVWLGGIEQIDSTKSLWAAVMWRRAGEDQRAAPAPFVGCKMKQHNESHLNAAAGWFEYKSTTITTTAAAAVAAADIYQRAAVLRLEVGAFRCCCTFGEETKKTEREVHRSLHDLLLNGLTYHNFWCFARGRNKGSMFLGPASRRDHRGLISVDYSASLSCCLPLSLSPRRAAGPDWID